jgi:O-antigen ligase
MNIKSRLGRVVLWGAGVTTLLVTPFFSYDPINVPRFLSVLVFGLMGFFLLLGSKKELLGLKYRKVVVASAAFVIWAFIAMFDSKINLTDGFLGVTGRQTGFLAYVALIVLMLCAVVSSVAAFQSKLALVLVLAGLASGLYGVLQAFGGDPFDWINPYSPVFGFFGNPNFQASFMGMAGVAAVASGLKYSEKLMIRVGLLAFVLLALFNIYKSKSQQGYLVFLAGVVVVGYLYVRGNSKFKKISLVYLVASVVGFMAVLLDILQKSPWSSILYKESVTFRGDFWRAGWKMTLDNPVFGVGLDGYRDHYRASRDLVTALRPGSDAMTDSAHNVFLDISSGGGFPLLIMYLFLVGLTIFSAIKVIRRSSGFDVGFAAVLGAWVAYLAQSVISINQLGLAVWGWIISGLIIGYEINTRTQETPSVVKPAVGKGRNVKSVAKEAVSAKTYVSMAVGGIIGLLVGLPPFIASAQFKTALETADAVKIEESAFIWPDEAMKYGQVGLILQANKLDAQAQRVVNAGLLKFPDEFGLWSLAAKLSTATPEQIAEATAQMKRLDPNNPDVK